MRGGARLLFVPSGRWQAGLSWRCPTLLSSACAPLLLVSVLARSTVLSRPHSLTRARLQGPLLAHVPAPSSTKTSPVALKSEMLKAKHEHGVLAPYAVEARSARCAMLTQQSAEIVLRASLPATDGEWLGGNLLA